MSIVPSLVKSILQKDLGHLFLGRGIDQASERASARDTEILDDLDHVVTILGGPFRIGLLFLLRPGGSGCLGDGGPRNSIVGDVESGPLSLFFFCFVYPPVKMNRATGAKGGEDGGMVSKMIQFQRSNARGGLVVGSKDREGRGPKKTHVPRAGSIFSRFTYGVSYPLGLFAQHLVVHTLVTGHNGKLLRVHIVSGAHQTLIPFPLWILNCIFDRQ